MSRVRSRLQPVLWTIAVLTMPGLCQQAGTATAAPSPQAPQKSVTHVPRARIAAAAAQIDRLLEKGLQRLGKQPSPIADDATFVRRAYLQIVGRIPNLDELAAFTADLAADKRARLVDQLLDAPGHTSHIANVWFDLLRVKSRQRQVSGEPFAHWLREAIRTDLPYDQFVAAMVTATGAAHQEGNGATGYLLRDANMPHDAMANTLRLFTGTRVECAQCHNHPTDQWTQREFYASAAFYGGLRYRIDIDRQLQQQVRDAMAAADDRQKQAARRVLQTFSSGIAGSGTGVERLPQDYKYDDAKPRDPVPADTLYGDDVKRKRPAPAAGRQRPRDQRPVAAEVDSRAAFAEWLTSRDNERFLRVITNRIWQRLFGRGLIEPVDDLKADSQAVHPELQAYLEKLLVDLRFDRRQFERVLLSTRLFQQEASATDPPADRPWAFAAPLLQRLSAEQLWDSLLTLVFADVDTRLRPTDTRAREFYDRQKQLTEGSPEEVLAMLQRQGLRFADPQRFQQEQQKQQEAARARSAEQQQRIRELQRELLLARRKNDLVAVDRLQRQLDELGVARPGERTARGREGELLRASDLVQPAPANHLLRQFGQSDREAPDGGSRAATVPQALTLMNGPLATGDSSLRQAIQQAVTPAAKVRTAFLAILSREPSPYETAMFVAEIEQSAAAGAQDLAWVLCNTDEFRFCR